MKELFFNWIKSNNLTTNLESEFEYKYIIENIKNNDVIEKNKSFLEKGGNIIFFEPFEIFTNKKKVLITGIDGQIGYYVKKIFKDCELFGLVNKENFEVEKDIIKIKIDITNKFELEKIILMIKPEHIIHLAGISSTSKCNQLPDQAILINGVVGCNICDIIHKNNLNIKLFNASTSEIYKGHIKYNIKNIDYNHYPTHPYSIAKNLSHNMIDWYRNNFGHHFSNGIIFTTESRKRGDEFLTKKLLNHISSLKNQQYYILKLGNLDSNRTFIHANDVSIAIKIILEQDKGDNYNICGDKSYNIKYFLIQLYKYFGIDLIEKDNCFYLFDIKVIQFENNEINETRPDLGIDKNSIITGDNSKLKKLGWIIPENLEQFIEQIDKEV